MASWNDSNSLPTSGFAADRLTEEAAALVSGADVAPPPPNAGVLRERWGDIDHRKKVVTRAIDIQQRILSDMRAKFSNEICREVKPVYGKVILEVAQAAVRLARAMEKERNLRDSLHQADVSTGTLDIVVFKGPGHLDDPYSRVNHFLSEAERLGYINREVLL